MGEQKEEKQKQKLLKKEERLAKDKETKMKKERSKQETKRNQEMDLNISMVGNKNKSIINSMIEKVRKRSTEDKETVVILTRTKENENIENIGGKEEETQKFKLDIEEEK